MQVSKKKLSPKNRQQILSVLYQVVADLKNPTEVKLFLNSFLTKNETLMLAKRLAIASLLNKKESYDTIKNKIKISSATVASTSQHIHKNPLGFNLAMKKIQTEQWAANISQKINQVVTRVIPKK